MARSIHTTTYSNNEEDYHAFGVIWHWDDEGIPFKANILEYQWSHKEPECVVELDIIRRGMDNLTIKDENGDVIFSLKDYQITRWLEAELEYEMSAGYHMAQMDIGDMEYDRKRDDELTEVEA